MNKPAAENSGTRPSIWAVVPAAGIGKRMQSDIPKQYLSLQGVTVLEHTLKKLLSVDAVKGLVVAIQEHDKYWSRVELSSDKPILIARGGEHRSDSVLNALNTLAGQEGFDEVNDWVMVHDAVRPCVRVADIELLVTEVANNDAGGLLALAVRDTMKRQGTERVVQETVDREGLWHALTPQLFPFKLLRDALVKAADDSVEITDESSAVEYSGFCPLLVQGSDDNIKITRPGDLRLAELYLQESGK